MSFFIKYLIAGAVLAVLLQPVEGSQRDLIDFKSPEAVKQIYASGQPDSAVKYENGKIAFVIDNSPKTPWAGIAVKPVSGVWNLSDYGYIEVNITNPNNFDFPLYVRVDDDSKLIVSGAWVTGQQKIKANASETVRVYLADMSYGRKYILQPDQISQLLIFGGKSKAKTSIILNSITAGGKPGETPAWFLPLLNTTGDGVLADFTGISDSINISPKQANISKVPKTGLKVSFNAASGGAIPCVLISPVKAKWNLIFFNQVDFYLANPGNQPQSILCTVNNYMNPSPENCASESAIVPPGEKMKVTVSFVAKSPWQSYVQSDGKAKTTDAASERTRTAGDKGGQDLTSDEVSAVIVASGNPAAPGEIVVEKIVASVAGPDQLPEWSGTRPPVSGNWTQTLNENFDGDAINDKLWNKKMPWVGLIPNELQRYNPNNVSVKDGMLHLRATRENGHLNGVANPAFPEGKYTSAVVTTYEKWSQAYGYFEARLKPQRAIGVWPAFWGMPFHGPGQEARRLGTTHGGAEIDIFEHPSRFGPYRSNIAVHWDNYAENHKKTGISRVYYNPDKDGFVTAGLLWEPGKLTWYVNQKIVGIWESPAVPTVAIYLKLTIQMGNWGGFIVEDSKLAKEDFVIDYVRVWQRDDLANVNKK